ncbi:hypothetical protein A3L04_06255 [Thermococcus chitonophagus]|uniref:Uncharacterized protein n=1 Tax=Thermococcus chitonophagus TaxID=54262 RepID=A0A2Z2N8Q4_9EURY|nr:PCNA-inhibitor [Thermococcus chitonophagus]ASJ16700.1 hypothetical protein A3L04_06255 [Thermococcus chitonophagus]
MDRKIDDFINPGVKVGKPKKDGKKKKRLKATKLDSFLPEEHINFFKNLRIGSKKIARKKIEEL